ncbi:MAG: ribbon-helix-helix protein, CopG family [Candidatus Thermoplasmatota archaeon]
MQQDEACDKVNERVTIRLGREEIFRIDSAADELNCSRSEFVRRAMNDFIERKKAEPAKVTVELTRLEQEYIDTLLEAGYYSSREHAVRKAVETYFTKRRMAEVLEDVKIMAEASGRALPFAIAKGERGAISR